MRQVNLSKFKSGFHFFDAHCHLQEPEIMWDIAGIMDRWEQNCGRTIVCCGTKESDWRAVSQIASQYENVIPCFGVHPWFVQDASETWLDTLNRYLDISINGKIPFVGEIGLDNVLKKTDYEKQEKIFKIQIGIAKERKIPVSIHMRKGWNTLVNILKYMGPIQQGGVIHSYSGSADMVPILEKYGFYISFSGSVTHPDNKKVKKSLSAVSPHRLLIETDSPAILPRYPEFYTDSEMNSMQLFYSSESLDLFPEPLDTNHQTGKIHDPLYEEQRESHFSKNSEKFMQSPQLYDMGWNEPCNIFLVALAVSRILGTTLAEVARITAINGKELFQNFF